MKKQFLNALHLWMLFAWMGSLFTLAACSDNKEEMKEETPKGEQLVVSEDDLDNSIDASGGYFSVSFTALVNWTATLQNPSTAGWVELSPVKGEAGKGKLAVSVGKNETKEERKATVVLAAGTSKKEITITQEASTLTVLDPSQIKDFDKYYKPQEFKNIDMLRSDAKWSWTRHKQSEHFFVFWEQGFGDDPNALSLSAKYRVDIDDLLLKAEQFYKTNIETLKMAEVGDGKSTLEDYKMQIYLLYQEEWLATGAGYDDKVGALWVNPSTCQPVGATIAHEIGHSFQYQIYCDQLKQGAAADFNHGFRYNIPGSQGCGFWEQCAQWQSFQDYPDIVFTTYDFPVWLANYHRHFSHEWMRYASYWLQYYWAEKHGIETLGNIWRESRSPEDAIMTYMRLYCANQWTLMQDELYDYAARMATYDIERVRNYNTSSYQDNYTTKLYEAADGFYQVGYASCPGTTGFNVIALNLPEKAGESVTVDFEGLKPGAPLAESDPGVYMESEKEKGTVKNYNNFRASEAGWRYGFVALKQDGTRVYGEMNTATKATVQFVVPQNTEKLYLVVQGSPLSYRAHPWDEKELNDEQWPYKVRFHGTDLLGRFTIDTTADPQDVEFSYDVKCDAASSTYELGVVNLMTNSDVKALAQAFVMQPNQIAAATLPIAANQTATPAEGKVALGLLQPDGTISYAYSANVGFYCHPDGGRGAYGQDSPVFVEYDKDGLILKYGHHPGQSVVGQKYTLKPVLVYTKEGKQYKATFILNLQF